MIVSASRRTDIPAFFGDWLFRRLGDGYCLVRHPRNPQLVRKVTLTPEAVDCLVFWTKNPQPLLERLPELDRWGRPYYFLFTLTPYDRHIEPHLPAKRELLRCFAALADRIGPDRVVWRYDPILFAGPIDSAWHIGQFSRLARQLAPHTRKCIISFLDLVPKCRSRIAGIGGYDPADSVKIELAGHLASIAGAYGLPVESCAEPLPLAAGGVQPCSCIDRRLIARLCGAEVAADKDKNQRRECGCLESLDIGAYDTCRHGCLYCYAASRQLPLDDCDPASPFLSGNARPDDRIVAAPTGSCLCFQPDLGI